MLAGCEDPVFLECDGGRLQRADGSHRCLVDDAGPPPHDAGAPKDDAGAPQDDASTPRDDAGTPPGDAGAPPDDGGTFVETPEDIDAPDCLDELACPFASPHVIDLNERASVTITGQLDGDDHLLSFPSCGPRTVGDRDIYRVLAPARTFVEVTVERQDPAGLLTPVLETWDSRRLCPNTYAGGAPPVRTVFMIASPTGEHSLVQVWDEAAYDERVCTSAAWRGGTGYGYRLTFRRCDECAIQELGRFDGSALTAEARLEQQGDIAVFRFTADPDAQPRVHIEADCPSALGSACEPSVVALRPAGGGALVHFCDRRTSIGELPVDGEERLFAVLDYQGQGAPGYVVSVRAASP